MFSQLPVKLSLLIEITVVIIDKQAAVTEIRVSERYCPWTSRDLRVAMRTKIRFEVAATKRKFRFPMDAYRQLLIRLTLRRLN